jgi:hypothetical protein
MKPEAGESASMAAGPGAEALAAPWNEADELIRIFVAMAGNTKAKSPG